ncbi:hypothetical protein KCU85_g8119, partial [Aureobasidium melanogenum]
MTALKRVQITDIFEIESGERVSPYTLKWCSEVREFILNGGVLSESLPFGEEEDEEEDDESYDFSVRKLDQPEEGLWGDYDNNMNFGF